MNNLFPILLIIFGGIVSVTTISIVGSVVSRKISFNSFLLSILSVTVYVVAAYLILQNHKFAIALLCCNIVGLYDSTIGWIVLKKIKSKLGKWEQEADQLSLGSRILIMIVFSSICTIVTYWIL